MSQTTDANSSNAFNAWSRTPGKSVRNANPSDTSPGSMFLPPSISSRSSTSAWGSTGDSPVNSPLWAPTRPTSLLGGGNNKPAQPGTSNSISLMHQVSAPADCLWSTGFLADSGNKSGTPQAESKFQSHWIDGDLGCNVTSADKWAVSPGALSSTGPVSILSGWGPLQESSSLEQAATSGTDLFLPSSAAAASVWASDVTSLPPNSSSSNLSCDNMGASDVPLTISTALETTSSQPSSGVAETSASSNQTWAQAAGKGILPLPATAQGQPTSQKGSGASSIEDSKRREQDALINARVLSNEGWGQRPIDQSLPWDVADVLKWYNGGSTSSATVPDGDTNRRGGGLEPSVWVNEPPTGTGIWEDYYQNQGKKTARWQGVFGATGGNQPGTPIGAGKMSNPWDSRDAGMWPADRPNINRMPTGSVGGWGETGAASLIPGSGTTDHMMSAGTNNNSQGNNIVWPPDKRRDFPGASGATSGNRIGNWNEVSDSAANWPSAVSNMDPVGRINDNTSDLWSGSNARTPVGSRSGSMASQWPSADMNDMMSPVNSVPNSRGPGSAVGSMKDWLKDSQYLPKRPIGPMQTNMNNPNSRYKGDHQMRAKQVDYLVQMGFKYEEANNALINNNMDLERTIAELRDRQGSATFGEIGDFGGEMSSLGNMPGNPRMFGNMGGGRGCVANNPHLGGQAGTTAAFNGANPQIMGQQILQQMRFALNQRMQTPNNPGGVLGVGGTQQRPSNRESMLRQNILIQKQKLQSVQQKISSLLDGQQSRNESHQTQMQRQMLLERAQNEFQSLTQHIAQNETELQRLTMSGGAGMMPPNAPNMPSDLIGQMGDMSLQGSNRSYSNPSGKSWSQNNSRSGGRWMGPETNNNPGNYFPGGSSGGGTDHGMVGGASFAWLLLQSIPAHLNLDAVKSALPPDGLIELIPNVSNRWILLGYANVQYAIKAMDQLNNLNGRAGIVQPVSESDALQKKQEIQNLATRFNLSGPPNPAPVSSGLMGSPGPPGSSSTIGGTGSSLWGMPPPSGMPGGNNPLRMMSSDGGSVFDHPGGM